MAHGSDPLHPEFAELIAGRFAALADPMRLRLIDALRTRHEASVQELAEALDAGHANVSKHLGVLQRQRIVTRRKEGTRAMYRILDSSVLRICEEICGALEAQLRELAALIDAPAEPAPTGTPNPEEKELA